MIKGYGRLKQPQPKKFLTLIMLLSDGKKRTIQEICKATGYTGPCVKNTLDASVLLGFDLRIKNRVCWLGSGHGIFVDNHSPGVKAYDYGEPPSRPERKTDLRVERALIMLELLATNRLFTAKMLLGETPTDICMAKTYRQMLRDMGIPIITMIGGGGGTFIPKGCDVEVRRNAV